MPTIEPSAPAWDDPLAQAEQDVALAASRSKAAAAHRKLLEAVTATLRASHSIDSDNQAELWHNRALEARTAEADALVAELALREDLAILSASLNPELHGYVAQVQAALAAASQRATDLRATNPLN